MKNSNKGQALIMLTLASFAMCGVMGLAVDIGWAHFTKKAAQSAADSAALSAAQYALETVGQGNQITCGGAISCLSAYPCPDLQSGSAASSTADAGCLYADRNGFEHGGRAGRQRVVVAANTTTPPPTAPGVVTDYWATVSISERIPQLFSSLIAPEGQISTRATAAVIENSVYGSLMLLNRENDCLPMESSNNLTCGVNLLVSANDNQGMDALRADGGIFLSSGRNGEGGRYAGENTGGGTIRSPYTYIRGSGGYYVGGSARWIQTPRNRNGESLYSDPMRGKSQPKAPTGLADRPVAGGTINGSNDANNPLVLPQGNYFATNSAGTAATGDSIQITGNVRFSNGGSGFGHTVFFGGVNVSNSNSKVVFEPGMYVFAGVRAKSNGDPNALFELTSNATVGDLTPGTGPNTDAGEVFVFTDPNYRGQGNPLQIPALVIPIVSQLKQGLTGFHTGSTGAVNVNLHGLNRNSASLPSQLKTFAPAVMWQDQANSVVKHTADGDLDTSCGSPSCPNTALASNKSPELFIQGSPTVHLYGTVYQPRGGWISIQGGGDYQIPLQVIAGALRVQGNSSFSMVQPVSPITRRTVALVE